MGNVSHREGTSCIHEFHIKATTAQHLEFPFIPVPNFSSWLLHLHFLCEAQTEFVDFISVTHTHTHTLQWSPSDPLLYHVFHTLTAHQSQAGQEEGGTLSEMSGEIVCVCCVQVLAAPGGEKGD